MIPSVISNQVRWGIEDFLRTTFPIHTPYFNGMMERLLDASSQDIFKGPYVSVKLPFTPGSSGRDYFPEVALAFPPYLHQEQAFQRLAGNPARSTLIATGTGSGKTEGFLYPILNHCWQKRGEPGIKAIVIYPMNALATDQARRFARIIHDNANLNGTLRVGLYVAGGALRRRPGRARGQHDDDGGAGDHQPRHHAAAAARHLTDQLQDARLSDDSAGG